MKTDREYKGQAEESGNGLANAPRRQRRTLLAAAVAIAAFVSIGACPALSLAQVEPANAALLEDAVDPGANERDEAMADAFSFDRAVAFLDNASLTWQKDRKCFACHTNYAYLYARPLVSADAPAHAEVRRFAEELVTKRWETVGPRWDAELVATAAALAFNDARTTGKLHPVTRAALDKMWTKQREDGSWKWLNCEWPPFEMDDYYGVNLAALAVAVAPDDYAKTEAARVGMDRIRSYLRTHPPETLHQEAMTLWASSLRPDLGLMTNEQRAACVERLVGLQRPDGGWSLPSLGNWKREDGSPQDVETSDGYGTGFVVYVLHQSGTDGGDERLQRGVAWLKSHQRASGRWFTRSLKADGRHFMTHAGTAFAVMAIASCEEKSAGASSEAAESSEARSGP